MESDSEDESFLVEETMLKARWQKLCKAVHRNVDAARSQAQRKGSYVCCVPGGKRQAGIWASSVQCAGCFGWLHVACTDRDLAEFEQAHAADFHCKFCEQQAAENANAHNVSESRHSDRVNQELDNAEQVQKGHLAEHELEAFLQSDKCYTCGFQAKLGSVFRCGCGTTFHITCEYTEKQLELVASCEHKCRSCRDREQFPNLSAAVSEHFQRSVMSPLQAPIYPLPCPCGVQKFDTRIKCERCHKSWHLSCAKECLDFCSGPFVCAGCVSKELSALKAEHTRITQGVAVGETRLPSKGILKVTGAPQQCAVQRDRFLSPSPQPAMDEPLCFRCVRPALGADDLGKCKFCRRLFHARCGEVELSALLSQIGCDACRSQRFRAHVNELFPDSGNETAHQGIANAGKVHADVYNKVTNMQPIRTSTPLPSPRQSFFEPIPASHAADNSDFALLVQQICEMRAEFRELQKEQLNTSHLIAAHVARAGPQQPAAQHISVSDLPLPPNAARNPHASNPANVSNCDPVLGGYGHDGGTAQQTSEFQLNVTGTKPVEGVTQSVVGELASALKEALGDNRIAQTLVHIRKLQGNEGPDSVRTWFQEFELVTKRWSDSERLEAMGVKLQNHARTVFLSLPAEVRLSYASVREELLLRLANDEQGRTSSMVDLLNGKPRAQSETIEAFGDRILKMVRSACTPDCPSGQIEELCKSYFLQWIGDRELVPSLTEQRNIKPYRYLVDHAATLRRSLDLLQPMTPAVQHAPAQRNNYRWNGNAAHAAQSSAHPSQAGVISSNAPQFTAQFSPAAAPANAQTKQHPGYAHNAATKQSFAPNAPHINGSAQFPKVPGGFAKALTADPPHSAPTFAAPQQLNTLATWSTPARYVNPYSVPPPSVEPSAIASSLFVFSAQPEPQDSHGEDAASLLHEGGDIGLIVGDRKEVSNEERSCAEGEPLSLSTKWLHPSSILEYGPRVGFPKATATGSYSAKSGCKKVKREYGLAWASLWRLSCTRMPRINCFRKFRRRRSTKTAFAQFTLDASRSQQPTPPCSAQPPNSSRPTLATSAIPPTDFTLRHALDPISNARPPSALPLRHSLDSHRRSGPATDSHSSTKNGFTK